MDVGTSPPTKSANTKLLILPAKQAPQHQHGNRLSTSCLMKCKHHDRWLSDILRPCCIFSWSPHSSKPEKLTHPFSWCPQKPGKYCTTDCRLCSHFLLNAPVKYPHHWVDHISVVWHCHLHKHFGRPPSSKSLWRSPLGACSYLARPLFFLLLLLLLTLIPLLAPLNYCLNSALVHVLTWLHHHPSVVRRMWCSIYCYTMLRSESLNIFFFASRSG